MKYFFLLILSFCATTVFAQDKSDKDTANKPMIVEASCGKCKFDMPGDDCELAVRIDGKGYYVDGTAINDHGNAHAADGFCNAIRKANVKGEIVDNRFKASSFKLVNEKKKKKNG